MEAIELIGRVQYVLGFVFSENGRRVLLKLKAKGPEAVVGCLNGIGGKVEDGERPRAAMIREASEELSGELVCHWRFAGRLYGDGWVVWIYETRLERERLEALVDDAGSAEEDEPIGMYGTFPHDEGRVPNLRWMLPLCLSGTRVGSKKFDVEDGS